MNTKDIIYDVIEQFIKERTDPMEVYLLTAFETEKLSREICNAIGICVNCGQNIRERNVRD